MALRNLGITFYILLSITTGSLLGKITGKDPGVISYPVSVSSSLAQEISQQPGAHIGFGHLGLESGLSQSSILAITQDAQGFMWFGTEDGLNRFDGEKFKIFRPNEGDASSISDVWISALALDADEVLWVGTRQGGANRYDAKTGKFNQFLHNSGSKGSLSSNNIHVIFLDNQKRLWFGTDQGLDLFNQQEGNFERIALPPQIERLQVQDIAEDALGNLWLGTSDGLWLFDPHQRSFIFQKITNKIHTINNILVDSDGSLWLASVGGGLIHYYPQTEQFDQFLTMNGLSDINIHQLRFDPSGKIWVGTANGLNLFDPVLETSFNYFNDPNESTSLSRNYISTFYQDSSGILWIGTYGGGLNFYDPLANKFTHFYREQANPDSLSDNYVLSFAFAQDGTVWIGTFGGGLNHYDPRTNNFTHYHHDYRDPNSLRNDYVNSVLVDGRNSIWIGTESGLDRLDPGTGIFKHILSDINDRGAFLGNQINTIFKDSSDTLWIGTNSGLAIYNPSRQAVTRFYGIDAGSGMNEEIVTSIIQDHKGIIWVGTFSNGLSRFDPQTGTISHYTQDSLNPNSISNDSILTIFESLNDELWVGTAGGGLNRYDSVSDTFISYNDKNGLPNNIISGIQEDKDGALWLSTNFGIAQFDPLTGISRNFTVSDGLQSNEFNPGAFAKDGDGNMYFGGTNGFNVFQPSNMKENHYIPQISLISVLQNGNPLEAEITPEKLQDIILNYPDNSFEFEYIALSYSQSNKNQYAYKLEGYDSDWYFAGTNRTGRYSNLPGGQYILRMKASNSDGIWNEEGLALKVIIVPPFWRTNWFYSILVFGSIGGIAGMFLSRARREENLKRELERQVAERTREIEQLFEKTKDLAIIEERNRLARELHDSAKQKAFAALAQVGTANEILNKNPKAAKNHLGEAENLVYEVIEELTFLIQEMYPVALKEKGLVATVREYVFEWEGRTDIQADVNIKGERRLSLNIEQAIFRVIQEALSNVSRHSGADHVEVKLTYSDGQVEVIIVDNGCGFDKEVKSSGMGLLSIQERIQSVAGTVEIFSLPDCGTRLIVNLPV